MQAVAKVGMLAQPKLDYYPTMQIGDKWLAAALPY